MLPSDEVQLLLQGRHTSFQSLADAAWSIGVADDGLWLWIAMQYLGCDVVREQGSCALELSWGLRDGRGHDSLPVSYLCVAV